MHMSNLLWLPLIPAGGPSAGAGGPKPGGISADLLFTPEERAARERREFEEKIRKLLKCDAC